MPPGMGPPTARINVVTIATDEGIDGHVFVTGPGVDVTPQLLGGAKQLLVGRDPLDIGAIWHDFRLRARMFDPTVQGYVDIALWDIAGKAAGLPVHRLLGSARTSVPSYSSSWVHPNNATYVEEALAYRERGFVGYKLHPPTQRRRMPVGGPPGPVSIREDIETCAAVRDARRRRLLPDARLGVGVLVQGGARRRLRHRGRRLSLVRGSARRRRHRRVLAAQAAPLDPDRRHRDHERRPLRAAALDRGSCH